MKERHLRVNKTALLIALAVLLVLGASITASQAYFTTFAEAEGGHSLSLGSRTELDEEVNGLEKQVSVRNTGDLECYVRVKAFAGDDFTLKYAGEAGWKDGGDGYWYYEGILAVGAATPKLTIGIDVPDAEGKEISDFNVVVIQECTPVLYDEDGNPYADWNMKATNAEGGNN